MAARTARFVEALDEVWLKAPSIALGQSPTAQRTPDQFVLVEEGGVPKARLDLYWPPDCFHHRIEALVWQGWIALGGSALVYLVALEPQRVIEISLAADAAALTYFMNFKEAGDDLLVVGGTGLLCLAPDGQVRWRNDDLAIDGVVIHEIAEGVIRGEGDWDPPDGWEAFAVDLTTGLKR